MNARLFPNFPPPLSELRGSIDVHDQSRNSLPPLPSQHSQPELSTSTSSSRGKLSSPLSLKRNPSTVPGNSAFRSSSLGVPPVKKRQSGASLQAPHGRLYKLLGDFFLLAGRTVDAVIWWVDNHIAIVADNDNLGLGTTRPLLYSNYPRIQRGTPLHWKELLLQGYWTHGQQDMASLVTVPLYLLVIDRLSAI